MWNLAALVARYPLGECNLFGGWVIRKLICARQFTVLIDPTRQCLAILLRFPWQHLASPLGDLTRETQLFLGHRHLMIVVRLNIVRPLVGLY